MSETAVVVPLHPNQIVKGNRPVGKPRGAPRGPVGSAANRRARKRFLLETYRANVDVVFPVGDAAVLDAKLLALGIERILWDPNYRYWSVPRGEGVQACRCYRCGRLLVFETMTVDRIVPGCKKTAEFPKGGTYRRNNIRPACCGCQSETGGALGAAQLAAKRKGAK